MQSMLKIVCPCNPDEPMELVKIGGMVYEKCFHKGCVNRFPYDCVVKVQDKVDKYYLENHKYEGFSHYFHYKDSQMRARVISSESIDQYTSSVTVEIANLTYQPQYKQVNKR